MNVEETSSHLMCFQPSYSNLLLNANDHVVQKGFFQGREGSKIEFIFPGYAEKGLVTASQIALADCILPQVTSVFIYIYSLTIWKYECADMVGAF